jgi:hypothetical protein
MSEALSLTQIEGQHVELLPARTVLSLFSAGGDMGGDGGYGGDAKVAHNVVYGNQYNWVTGGSADGGSADGGSADN